MPSPTSRPLSGFLQQVAAAGGEDPPVGAHHHVASVAACLVEANDEIAVSVVGELHRVELDARRRSSDTTGVATVGRRTAARRAPAG